MRPRILVTLSDKAEPADNGKRLRAAAAVRALAEVGDLDVVLLHLDHPLDIRPLPADVPTHHWSVLRKKRRSLSAAALRMLRLLPLQIAAVDWTEMRAEISRLRPRTSDLVWFGSLDHFVVLRDLIGDTPAVVDYDDVEPAKIKAFLAVAPRDLSGQLMRAKARVERLFWRRLERVAKRRSAALIVCSDLDVQRLAGPNTLAVPNTYPDPGPAARRVKGGPPEFLMIANFGYKPNIDAANFAAREILPTLRRALPDAVIHLAGHESDRYLTELRGLPGIRLTGAFPEVRPLLENATAVIAPIRYGGGTRLKIIEAWAYGVPVVSTTMGAEGLHPTDGTDLLLVDAAYDFATACIRVTCDPELRRQLSYAGRLRYEAAHRPAAGERAVAELLNELFSRR
jgi:glycosyltransferase involved in cell wall biosynthesis